MTYKPTGFPRGRPRKGEFRPRSPRAESIMKWRKKNYEYWLEKNREYQANWRSTNRERSKEISRNCYVRKKAWILDPNRSAFIKLAENEFHRIKCT
jgi:hypothetical protein